MPEPPTPLVSLTEDDPLSLAPAYFPMDAAGLLSDVEPYESVAVGLPPRVVDAALLKSMRQVGRDAVVRGDMLWNPRRCCLDRAGTAACCSSR